MAKKNVITGETISNETTTTAIEQVAQSGQDTAEAVEPLTEATQAFSCVPPNGLQRNEWGLLVGTNYVFDEDGYVDWRKMIDPKFLVAQKDAPNKPIEELKDNQLIILLGGIKKLARIRGYKSVSHRVIAASDDYVAVATTIVWRANYETSYEDVEFTALADAHGFNTEGLMKHYLAPIAENRGFVRAVRNFLGINIAGKEELGARVEDSAGDIKPNGKTRAILEKLLSINNIDFERFKNRMIKEEVVGADEWKSLEDIAEDRMLEIIGVVETVLEKAQKTK